MPIPPDYDEPETRSPTIRIKPPEDWVVLLVAGAICVGVAGGDLNNLGQQLTGAALTAFRYIVKQKADSLEDS